MIKNLEVFGPMSCDEKKEFINTYGQFYSDGGKKEDEKYLLGTVLANKTDESVEKYAEDVLSGTKSIDIRIFLWKAGKLTVDQVKEYADAIVKVVNGRGHEIENAKAFIDAAKKITVCNDFENDYKELLKISKETKLKNIGTVYLITLLFFMSKKEYPIYDYFAHRAVKALYLGKNPIDVFVGAAPDKTDLNKVFAMYREYKYLLEQVFGYSNIERKLDQALWVYGHANKQWTLIQ